METPYRLDIIGQAERGLKRVRPDSMRREITASLAHLPDEPYPPNSELEDELLDRYRLRFDWWRVIYKVDNQDRIITVLAVRRRDSRTYLNVP